MLILLLINGVKTLGQERETVLSAPENWQSEIIPFPMGFAPAIDFVGFEDLRFAPGWNDAASDKFWTYSFVWYVETYGAMTEAKLIKFFESYYDGLMEIDLKNQADSTNSNQLDKSRINIFKTAEGFKGTMRVFDKFFSKDYMNLNIKISEQFCPKMNRQIIFCDISPKAFDDAVWNIFDAVQLKEKCE